MAASEIPFEAPLVELRRRIDELESYPPESGRQKELGRLKTELRKATAAVYADLSRWEQTLVARHVERPHALDYVDGLMTDWLELAGDRGIAEDPAIVSGFATFRGRTIAVVGHQKGRGTRERIRRNFGQPRPEGYRKALRIMKMAERFRRPVLCLVDTPGAYPGIGAEERGQAEAIARNLREMALLETPIVVVVTGEGGSGGALALGVGDRVHMLQYSIYSVISPEGCAAILWKDQSQRETAAEALRLTAQDLLEFEVIDQIIEEPLGAAHSDPDDTFRRVGEVVERSFTELGKLSIPKLVSARYDRFRALGAVA